MVSFTDSRIEYNTTADTCDCKAREFNPNKPCKHMEVFRAQQQQAHRRYRNIDEARAARIQRNKETARCYRAMMYMEF